MPEYKQENRPIKINTPLGEDKLLLERFEGKEGVSQLFEFHLHMVSTEKNLPIENLLQKPATLYLQMPNRTYRYINGWVRSARMLELDMGLTTYQMELVPWLWFTTQVSDCRIFQNKTVQEIISQVFSDRGFNDFSFRLTRGYKRRKFCVQYRETDFNFVTRLMEEEGMHYFFTHTETKHVLVITDGKAQIQKCPVQSDVRFAVQAHPDHPEDFLHTLDYERSYRTGKVTLKDYDFIKPTPSQTELMVNVSGKYGVAEKYDYPGLYYLRNEGDQRAKDWLEMEEWPENLVRGISSCRSFITGHKFTLKEHFRGDMNKEYTLLAVYHRAEGCNYRTELEEPFRYTNTYEAIPATIQFRAPRLAVKPTIKGTQTAVVTGPSGEEIYVDKYGRVKVHFHWDRVNPFNETSSCWIRVSQAWAGKAWGWITIPRIGQEVVVSFMEGDPDRPMITGRVYNDELPVPYTLPDHKTVSTFKSRSSKNGSPSNFNEIRFEDLKGQEQVFVHAEFDRDDRTKRDAREYIGRDRHMQIVDNLYEKIGKNKELQIGSSQKEKIGAKYSLKVGTDYHVKVGMNCAVDAGMEVHIKAGMKVIIEGGMQVSLKGPGGFVDIGPAGVTIQGTMVLINSGGSAGSGGGVSIEDPKVPDVADDGSKRTKLS